ncbi:MAG: hypothetical protein OEW00_12705 [candidate division Zixibacteria bacterium]|nr:hypothetical protein [candidate division Zixibacteria bacterium]
MPRTKKSTPAKVRAGAERAEQEKKVRKKGKLSTAEARREYQRRYYQLHKEKAKEYQRQYNLTHKKKANGGKGRSNFVAPREVVRSTFNTTDLMHSPVEKTVRMLEKIIKGERFFTM